jgi:predicted esterase
MGRARSVRRFVAMAALVLSSAWTSLADPPRPPTPTRADMARAYIAFERAYFARPGGDPWAIPTPPTDPAVVERANRAIDKAAVEMFGRNSAAAWARLRAETAWVELGREPGPVRLAADAFRAVADPPVVVLEGGDGSVKLTFTRLSPADDGAAQDVDVVLIARVLEGLEPNELAVGTVRLPTTPGERVTLDVPPGTIANPGLRTIVLDARADGRTEVGVVQVSSRALDERRDRVLAQLGVQGRVHTRGARRVEIVKARASLLTDAPGFQRSTDFFLDLNTLADQVESEAAGQIVRWSDDSWRVFFIGGLPDEGGVAVPVRVVEPIASAVSGHDERRALLIALHGAGGDENMFVEGYGAGILSDLALNRGMVVAAPLNSPLAAGPEVFDALVDQLAEEYKFDARRIYVLGHSMGTGAATAWSRLRSDKIAAAVNIAGIVSYGEGGPGARPLPPTLVVIPELDGLIPPARMNAVADAAVKAGLPVTVRRVPDYGHALVVGRILPEAVDWLLQHRLPDRPEAGEGASPAGTR